jgi:hypothetical protein
VRSTERDRTVVPYWWIARAAAPVGVISRVFSPRFPSCCVDRLVCCVPVIVRRSDRAAATNEAALRRSSVAPSVPLYHCATRTRNERTNARGTRLTRYDTIRQESTRRARRTHACTSDSIDRTQDRNSPSLVPPRLCPLTPHHRRKPRLTPSRPPAVPLASSHSSAAATATLHPDFTFHSSPFTAPHPRRRRRTNPSLRLASVAPRGTTHSAFELIPFHADGITAAAGLLSVWFVQMR